MKRTNRKIPFLFSFILGLAILIGMFVIAMTFGAADVQFSHVWQAIFTSSNEKGMSIIRELRLPREVAAMFVGAALAVSGAIMQGITRNPLADPGLLGLTAGANMALAITLAFLPGTGYFGIMVACFIGASIGAGMVFGISAIKKGGFSPFRIVLAGAAVSAFLYAIAEGVGIYFKISKDVSMWTAGGVIGTSWGQVQVIVPFITVGIIIALMLSRQLTILSLNEEVAIGLGQKTTWIKAVLFIIITLLAGASVALVGNMAFIGLMIPHIVRALVGTDYRLILPMSVLIGAASCLWQIHLAGQSTRLSKLQSLPSFPLWGSHSFYLSYIKEGKHSYDTSFLAAKTTHDTNFINFPHYNYNYYWDGYWWNEPLI